MAVKTMVVVMLMAVVIGMMGWHAEGQVHHVVGDDRGWDSSSDIASWSSRRVFRVGDFIWFAYSAAQENIVEVGSKDEYESCDLSNPIKMYTDGLDKVQLKGEGTRYFASGNPESCKKGLKLPVEVKPQSYQPLAKTEAAALAAAPTIPSGSAPVGGSALVMLLGTALLCLVAL